MHTCACSTNSTRLLGNLPAMAAKLPKSDEASAHIYQSNDTYSKIKMFIYFYIFIFIIKKFIKVK